MATTITLGRVVGSMIYTGTADSNTAIASYLTSQGITPLVYDLYVCSANGNLYQYQSADGTLTWVLLLNLTGPAGTFRISKVYSSVAAMNEGYATDGVPVGGLVVIDTGNVEDEDNAKLYVKGDTAYEYLTDMSGAQGIEGPEGKPGQQGERGEQGVGISSITKTGTVGLVDTYTISLTNGQSSTFTVTNGAQGIQGETGATGATPQITAQVTTLAAGSNATVSQTGSAEQPVLTFGIPRGNTGEQGVQGIQGEKGDTGATGATPQITVQVQGLAAGSVPTVSQTGTAENPTITLGIPAGATGAQGDGTVVQINGVNQTTMNFISTESTMESPDGTYICFIKATWAATSNKNNYTVTFPEPFLSAPSVVITPQTTQGIAFGVNNITTTSATLYIYGVTPQDESTGVNIVAIGRKAA